MKNTERERLLKVAAGYGEDELKLFIVETGWEDWMNEYADAADGEPISDDEAAEIDEILTDIFNRAHE